MKKLMVFFLFLTALSAPGLCYAMPPGTILYRTSGNGKMFGYSTDPLLEEEEGIVKNVFAGHAAIYIGKENGVDYIVEAMGGGIVKTPAKYFVNRAENETFLGAKIPRGASPLQQAKVVAIAKSLVGRNFSYDLDFNKQKGPGDGDWTCVGLSEKLYESANISNPNNLAALEYDPKYYAIDITPDGYDNTSVVNKEGDCFSRNREFSKVARRPDLVIPAPELIGYDLGLEHEGNRYIFMPYTQFIQPTLESVAADVEISSSFSGSDIRGPLNLTALVLRWSLINNPVSSARNIAAGVKELAVKAYEKAKTMASAIGNKLFGSTDEGTQIVLTDALKPGSAAGKKTAKSSGQTASSGSLPRVIVNKATPGTSKKNEVATNENKSASKSDSKSTSKSTSKSASASAGSSATSAKSSNSPTVKSSKAKSPAKSSDKPKEKNTVNSASTEKSPNQVSSSPASPTYYPPVIYNTVPAPVTTNNPPADNWPKIALINKISATGNNDWIELMNFGDHDFDLSAAGYRLEKTKTAEDPSLIIRLGNAEDGYYPGGTIIKAHDSYLIVRAGADPYYLSQADAIATRDDFSWTGSGYTFYVGIGALSSSGDPDIIDAVGAGAATYFQGTGPAPEITDYHFLKRKAQGENNAADFGLQACSDPAAIAALTAAENGEDDDTASSTDDLLGDDDTASSTDDLLGDDDTASSTDDQIGDDDTASSTDDQIGDDDTASSTDENSDDEEQSEDETDDQSDDSAATSTDETPTIAWINKVYASGNNDWIELINPNDYDFDLASSSYRLEKTMTAESPSLMMRIGNPLDGDYPGGTVIKAHGHYLIVRDDANQYFRDQADAIARRDEFGWTASGYTLYLGNNPLSSSTDADLVDAVGFGSDATYYLGTGPAPEITDNYYLNRLAFTGNNALDYDLLLSDDPSITIDPIDPEADLYVAPVPILSPGLQNLWHFSECFGEGFWGVGKWDCARQIGIAPGGFSAPLVPAADSNALTLSFDYREVTSKFPRVIFDLSDSEGSQIRVMLEPGMLTIEGLPNSEWRYYRDVVKFDEKWHRASLVINQGQDYWAIYLDGEEIIREDFLARLPVINKLEVRGDCDSYLVDEIAIWDRPLSSAEIKADYLKNVPFAPLTLRAGQQAPVLSHLYDFQEDDGTIAADSIGQAPLQVEADAWTGRAHDNYALRTRYGSSYGADFPAPIRSRDMSIAFWWRNSSYPIDGKAQIHLLGGEGGQEDLMAIIADPYRLGYRFDGQAGLFAEGYDKVVPHDGNWHHLALVYDSYRLKLNFFADGVKTASTSFIWIRDGKNAESLRVTTDGDASEIDDLGIYEGALSAGQVRKIYEDTK